MAVSKRSHRTALAATVALILLSTGAVHGQKPSPVAPQAQIAAVLQNNFNIERGVPRIAAILRETRNSAGGDALTAAALAAFAMEQISLTMAVSANHTKSMDEVAQLSLDIARRPSAPSQVHLGVTSQVAKYYANTSRAPKALTLLREIRERAQAAGLLEYAVAALMRTGDIYRVSGDDEIAGVLYAAAFPVMERLQSQDGLDANGALILASNAAAAGRLGDAERYFDAHVNGGGSLSKEQVPDLLFMAGYWYGRSDSERGSAATRKVVDWAERNREDAYVHVFERRARCADARAALEQNPPVHLAEFAAVCIDSAESQVGGADVSDRLALAQALERTGRLAEAAERFGAVASDAEWARKFATADIRAFFFNANEQGHAGLLRTLARQARFEDNAANAYFAAFAAAERMRARAYGDQKGDVEADAEALSAAASQLAEGVVAVSVTTLERQTIVMAHSRSARAVGIAELPRRDLEQRVSALHRMLRTPESNPGDIDVEAGRLAADLFGQSAASLLGSASKIIVVVDGPLALAPAQFWLPEAVRTRGIDVTYVPALRFVRHSASVRSPGGRFLGFGDPIYPPIPDAPGLTRQEMLAASRSSPAVRALAFQPLPGTGREVSAIAFLFGNAAVAKLGSAATEAAIKREDLSRYRYIHFATHGLLAGDFPGLLEPAIVLGAGDGEDGFLMAGEVSALDLSAELVVLSACNTGAGRLVAGEGVIGLSRAFLLAGADSVVASLWPVSDTATSALMLRFYAHKRRGLGNSAALTQAAQDIRGNAATAHPMYWAPFVLVSS